MALMVAGLFAGRAAEGADFNTPVRPTVSVFHGSNSSTISYRGQLNYQYVLYGSSNVSSWTASQTNLCTDSPMNFSETNRTLRFYQAKCLKTPQFYRCTFSGSENGEFMLFVRTDDTAALVGFDLGVEGAFSNTLGIGTNSQYYGTVFANRTGCLAFTSNSVSGSFSNGAARVGTVSGALKLNNGLFQSAAGIYSGGFSTGGGADCDGTLKGILAADGTFYLYTVYTSGVSDGGTIVLNSNGSFTVATDRGAHFTGTLNFNQRSMVGTFIHGCDDKTGFGSFSMARAEKLF